VKRSIVSRGAFSLVEVTLALGIVAFCLIAVFGLMPIGVQTNRNATSQTAATNIMAAVVADLRATPRCVGRSTQFQITLGTGPGCSSSISPSAATLYFDSSGQFATAPGTNSRYQLDITWSGSSGLRYADLNVTWPPNMAQVSPRPVPNGSTEMFVAFDRN
jgi:uncharacterized protein (TIGR02598 family)